MNLKCIILYNNFSAKLNSNQEIVYAEMVTIGQFNKPSPKKAGFIVVKIAIPAAAASGTKFVCVPQTKPIHGRSPNLLDMFTLSGSRAD